MHCTCKKLPQAKNFYGGSLNSVKILLINATNFHFSISLEKFHLHTPHDKGKKTPYIKKRGDRDFFSFALSSHRCCWCISRTNQMFARNFPLSQMWNWFPYQTKRKQRTLKSTAILFFIRAAPYIPTLEFSHLLLFSQHVGGVYAMFSPIIINM